MNILTTLLNIVLFIVMLGVLVTIHELGHFAVAKLFKVYVFEFSIGFGPKIFPWKNMKVKEGKKPRETKFSVRALPLGGFVSMYGEEGAVPEGFEEANIDPKRSLKGVNRGKRALIMAAGIIMNLILGYTLFLFSNGAIEQTFAKANKDFVNSATAVIKGLGSIFKSGLDGFSGPIGIFNMSASVLKNQGLANFLFLWGLISINLALFNLLPFPPLDGWHLLVVTVEAITRREISPKFKNIASMIGAIIMILFTILIIGKDIFTLFGVFL